MLIFPMAVADSLDFEQVTAVLAAFSSNFPLLAFRPLFIHFFDGFHSVVHAQIPSSLPPHFPLQ